MIYLELLLTFLKIGVVSFGGGMGMIPIIKTEVLTNGWLQEEEFFNMIAIAESTPGPIAINMATYIGNMQGGFLGALIATLAVILPAFIIILTIAAVLNNLFKNRYVLGAVEGVTPVIVSLLISTGLFLMIECVIGDIHGSIAFDYKKLIIISVLFIGYGAYYIIRKKKFNPILLIAISGILGGIFL